MLKMCGGVAVGLGRKYSTWSTRPLGGECKAASARWRRRKAGGERLVHLSGREREREKN